MTSNSRQEGRRRLRKAVLTLLTLAVVIGVVIGVYDLGGGHDGRGKQSADASQPHQLSAAAQERVGELMRKLAAHPRDAATLAALGNVYFGAGDYDAAGGWMERALALKPGDVTARAMLGAAQFNLGATREARRSWLRAIAEDPKAVEAYYGLGFLYISRDKPDLVDAKRMWRKVVALAPNSSIAKTVATHLKGLEKADAQAGGKQG